MLSISDKFFFKFSLGEEENFLSVENLEVFVLVEEAGNVLPTFALSFLIAEEKIMERLNEGTPIRVTYGSSVNGLRDTFLIATKIHLGTTGQGRRRVELKGVYNSLPYLSQPQKQITDRMSSIDAMKLGAPTNVEFDLDDVVTDDEQSWIQYNISNKRWVNEIWMHMNIPDSFPLVAMSSTGKFKVKDFKKLIKGKAKWRFVPGIIKDPQTDILYVGSPVFTEQSGFINSWYGYGREKGVYHIETGVEELIRQDVKSLLTLGKSPNRASEVGPRFDNRGVLNANTHPKYWEAYQRNLMSLAVNSTVTVRLGYTDVFNPVEVLDLVYLSDLLIGSTAISSKVTSGNYIVTRVARTLGGTDLNTIVELSRETLGDQKGELR